MTKTKSGFTIVELLIVIVVIAILAAISIVAYNGIQNRANNNARASTVATYVKAMQLYAAENGEYPVPVEQVIACFDGTTGCWVNANQARSTTLNTELRTVVTTLPSQSTTALTYSESLGFYIIYRLVDTSSCPSIGGATLVSHDVNNNVRQCRMGLPAI